MNRENLIRMADYLENVVHAKGLPFGMKKYRIGDKKRHYCDSVGCVIGHCTILDALENIPKDSDGGIDFNKWSEKFTGINILKAAWNWCFSPIWEGIDDTALGAAKRIRYLLEHGLPENRREQMFGEAELCYKSKTTNYGHRNGKTATARCID